MIYSHLSHLLGTHFQTVKSFFVNSQQHSETEPSVQLSCFRTAPGSWLGKVQYNRDLLHYDTLEMSENKTNMQHRKDRALWCYLTSDILFQTFLCFVGIGWAYWKILFFAVFHFLLNNTIFSFGPDIRTIATPNSQPTPYSTPRPQFPHLQL